ncbi:MAG TPA: ABC transporter permease [Candidatus Angelobacter sp.]|nr:ABC transporter permease [Candidatus Angelobacter sp.]
MLHEFRYALRTLKNSPAFTAVAMLTLALGIGANTTMFSVVNGVLLRQLDYPNASRIVQLNTSFLDESRSIPRLTGPDLVDIRAGASDFEQLSFYYGGEMGVQLADHAEFVGTYFVAPNFFAVFGLAPAFGCGFESREFQGNDVPRGAVVSLPFAQRNFGSGAGALGQTLHMEGEAYTIVGVAPGSFRFPREAQVWLATSPQPGKPWGVERTAYNYRVIALLRPGASLDAANMQLGTIGLRLQKAFPDSNKKKSFLAMSLRDQLVGSVRNTLYFLMGAVSLVLLIACANVANLMMARATTRQREMAVRSALGATRAAIARQLLVESSLIALAGGAVGLLLAIAGTRILTHATSQQVGLPRLADIQVNWTVFSFAIGVSLLSSFLFGMSPAWQAAKVDLNNALKQAARGLAGSSNRLRNSLVVVQVALSFALAIGAGLLFRTFLALNSVDLGFRTESMLVMYAHDPAHTLEDYLQAGRFFENAVAEMKRVPGVTSAAAAMGVPTAEYGSNGGYTVDGQEFNVALYPRVAHANFSLSGPGYFSTMAIPLLHGRDFNATDRYDRVYVAIISESLAQQSFPGKDPIGHTIECGLDAPPRWMTIVGVVADVRQDSPASSPGPTIYMPLLQHPFYGNEVELVLRSAVAPASLIEPVRGKMLALNPQVATRFTTMQTMVSDSIATPRLRAMLVGLFAGVALLLAVAGMYGVMSNITVQRIPEFGVRMALGASPDSITRLVLSDATYTAALGAAAGLALAFAGARVMKAMLFGLQATDAVTYAAVLLGVMPIMVMAAAIPAWRAARVDPMVALRNQ